MREHHNPFIREPSPDEGDYRLPKNVKPTHYDIHLEPDFENATFDGSVVIHFDVLQSTNFILLNTHEIEILSTVLIFSPGKFAKIPDVHFHEVQQTMMIPFPETIAAGAKIRIQQTFKGRLNDAKTMAGFNRSRYIGRDGKPKWIGSTQGQPVGARQIFPCADEPAFKATFAATLVVDHGLTALSNMDVSSEKSVSEKKKAVIFNTTPLMSTYLVAFVVAELDYIESNEYRVPVRIYATPDQDINTAKWLLDVSAKAMISHEKIFGSPYPLPKLDSVSVPGHAGGMENWGCVLYADTYLCADESDGSAAGNVRKAYVVTHELAHQWFGNIVTAEWWDSLWLNESFADWATYNAATHMWPEWYPWSEFVTAGWQAYQAALALDSNRGSHRIQNDVNTPGEIAQSFDAITYAKGCAILRMISELLGNEVFIKGVRLHLKRHAFGNATTDDLWDSLSTASGKNVQNIMSTWTKNVGYPILSVTEDDTSSTISITQHRFLQSGKVLPEDDQVLYPVYLKTKTLHGIDGDAQLLSREGTFPVTLATYKLNAGQTGLYRVSYPLSRWEKFGSQLVRPYLPELLTGDDRVGLISDLCAIAIAGQTTTRSSHFLTFLSNFKHETDYFVLRQLFSSLDDIHKAWLFEDAATLAALKRFQKDLMKKVLSDLGEQLWNFKPGEEYKEQGLKSVLFENAAGYVPAKVVASYLFERFMDGDVKALNPNIRQSVFKIVVSDRSVADNDENYNKLLHTFRTTKSVNTRTDVLAALASATLPVLIQRTIALVNSSEIQSLNERGSVFAELSTHPNGVAALWEWLKQNWDILVGNEGSIMGGSYVGSCIKGFSTREQLKEVEIFLKGRKGGGAKKFEKFLEQSLDIVRTKVGWVERDREDVRAWLNLNGYYNNE